MAPSRCLMILGWFLLAAASPARIVLADDHALVRSGLRLILDAEPDLQVVAEAADVALQLDVMTANTKFEFGLDKDGTLTLMDEILTPDSSRFWPVEGYVEGANPPSYDKQFVRDWLERATVHGQPWNKKAPAPPLDAEVVLKTAAKYQEAMKTLLG